MSTDPLIGKKLGDYIIVDTLGHGGMARVYRGKDNKLNRYAAVKVIDAQLIADHDQEEYRLRFQNEARAIARLSHSNIVGIYQFDQVGTIYYMAMSFIDGRDLRALLKDYAKNNTFMTYMQALRIIRDIGSALDYAHQEGVIHRDIKPSNIMVMPDGRSVLTDFGLALSVPEGTIGNTFGSAHYIAPEQAVSSAQAVPQSDLYSLGIVLFEMLTNRVPFQDQNAMAVAMKHLNDPPPAPSRYNPNLSSKVDQVVLKALNKSPTKRFSSGLEMARALEIAFALTDDAGESLSDSKLRVQALPSWGDTASRPTSPEQDGSRSRPTIMDDAPTVTDSKKSQASRTQLMRQQRIQRSRAIGIVAVVGLALLAAVFLLATSSQTAVDNAALTMTLRAEDLTATWAQQIVLAASQTRAAAANTTAESTDSAEATAEGAVDVTDEPTEAPTDTAQPSDTLTRQPTTTPPPSNTPLPTDTPRPTATNTPPPPTATPEVINVATTDSPIVLRYDDEGLMLLNQSNQDVDVSDLTFIQIEIDGDELIFESNRWQGGTRPTTALPPGDCFQVFVNTIPGSEKPDDCVRRHAWSRVSFIRWFWISEFQDATFEVRRNGDVLATCRIAARECALDVNN